MGRVGGLNRERDGVVVKVEFSERVGEELFMVHVHRGVSAFFWHSMIQ